jgi:antitoxin component YwqK of YwqJK toxin-antitoxin module
MKIAYCIIIYLLVCNVSLSQKTYQASDTKDNWGTLVRKSTRKPITGIVVDTYENGQQRTQSTYYKGKLTGNYKSWYENGQVFCECIYYNGLLDGKYLTWNEKGQLIKECYYVNGDLHGKNILWDEKGQLIQEFNFNYGEKDGWNREWYPNGQLKTDENYENLQKNGTFNKWNESGQLIKEDFYSNGMLYGDCKEWYDNGLLKWSANFDADTISGKIHGWYENGQIKYQLDNWHVKMWHDNGQMFYERIPPIINSDTLFERYWDESGKEIENPYPIIPSEEASFPGGMADMFEWIAQNYEYPEIAREMNLQGKIYISFGIRCDGVIFNVQILKNMEPSCPECEKSAIQMIKKMPIWNPKRMGKVEDIEYVVLPLNLSLGQ